MTSASTASSRCDSLLQSRSGVPCAGARPLTGARGSGCGVVHVVLCATPRRAKSSSREVQRVEVRSELVAKLLMVEGEFHRGLEEVQFVAHVVAAPLELRGEHRLPLQERSQGVRQPDLASLARGRPLQHVEDGRRENVALDGGEIGRASCRERV